MRTLLRNKNTVQYCWLKGQFQTKLQCPGTVRIHRVQERTTGQTACIAGGRTGARRAVARHDIVAAVSKSAVEDLKLRVVEDVEAFGAKF